MKELKKLFVGTDDFIEMIRGGYYYVDKTMLIKELIDKPSKVILFTRPRRFGKSMNMLMLKAYFEDIEENKELFNGLKIGDAGGQYLSEQGKYPVIYFTFKDIKSNTWEEMYALLSEQIRSEYLRHLELGHFKKLNQFRMADVEDYINRTATKAQMTKALENLTLYLHQTTGERPMILIDEYDAILMNAKEKGYGDEALPFIRNFLSAAMKTNEHMNRAILTGVMRIAQADIFSGFNNVDVETVLDYDFSTQFGFTQAEVERIAEYYGVQDQIGKIKEWYDGYLFGGTEIFNPWSVMNFIKKGCIAQAYWVTTGSNDLIKQTLQKASTDTLKEFTLLMNGGSVKKTVRTDLTYDQITDSAAEKSIYSLLMMVGYLKPEKILNLKQDNFDRLGVVRLKIPNREILEVYRSEIFEVLLGEHDDSLRRTISSALSNDDEIALQEVLRDFVKKVIGSFDTSAEGFYHALVLGLIAASDGRYRITSNRESGDGRYDLMLVSESEQKGILIEFKIEKGDLGSEKETHDKLTEIARGRALEQIEEKHYDIELRTLGMKKIGNGSGRSAHLLRRAYENVTVVGIQPHREAILLAGCVTVQTCLNCYKNRKIRNGI